MRLLPGVLAVALLSAACGPRTMQARLRDAERYADKASTHLDDAQRAQAAVDPKAMERSLDRARDFLEEKDFDLYPEAQMHRDRYRELLAALPAVKAAKEKKELVERLDKVRDRIVPRAQAVLDSLETLSADAPSAEQCDILEKRTSALKDALADEQELLLKDQDFAAWHRSQGRKVERAQEALARARRGVAFLSGPGRAWLEAQSWLSEAKARKGPAEREPSLREARGRLEACARDARPFAEDKATSGIAFALPPGKPWTPAQLAQACDKALKATEADWKKVSAALAKARR